MPYKDPDKRKQAIKQTKQKWKTILISFTSEEDKNAYESAKTVAEEQGITIQALIKRDIKEKYGS